MKILLFESPTFRSFLGKMLRKKWFVTWSSQISWMKQRVEKKSYFLATIPVWFLVHPNSPYTNFYGSIANGRSETKGFLKMRKSRRALLKLCWPDSLPRFMRWKALSWRKTANKKKKGNSFRGKCRYKTYSTKFELVGRTLQQNSAVKIEGKRYRLLEGLQLLLNLNCQQVKKWPGSFSRFAKQIWRGKWRGQPANIIENCFRLLSA